MFALVALPIPVRRPFPYAVPEELAASVAPGQLVAVPFGRGRRRGVVLELRDQVEIEAGKIKAITAVVDGTPVVDAHGLALAHWMAEYYLAPIGEAVAAQLPGGPRGVGRKSRAGASEAPAAPAPEALPRRFTPTAAQARAGAAVAAALEPPRFEVFLLQGVTGSGKTLVYLEAAEAAKRQGRQTLFLVPEISLAPVLLHEARRRFGGRVGVLHSYLTERDRRETWRRCRRGEFDLVLGARSAVFAPLPQPGLIVVDEEHEPAYKQSEQLRYHGRDVAVLRAQLLGVPCVLGSATPSLESYANAAAGKYTWLELPERVARRPLPVVEIVEWGGSGAAAAGAGGRDGARPERHAAAPALLTPRLHDLLAATLARREQALLFLNRRGHSRIVECEACGDRAVCPNCDLTLTFHSTSQTFLCHYCEHAEPALAACPSCGHPLFRHRGSGTQRVERELQALFPEARVHRLDSDSARRRGAAEEILESFGDGRGEILLGTQLVAKGHDFPGVTLVGVLNADTSIHLPDFRAAERTYQLLTQVAGRAGRGERPGHVVLQTRHPEHPALLAAAAQAYLPFARAELEARREARYPPYYHLISFLVSGTKEEGVVAAAETLAEWAQAVLAEAKSADAVEVLGPAPQAFEKLRGRYRWHVTLRAASRRRLHAAASRLLERAEHGRLGTAVKLLVDVDPVELL